MTAGLPDALYAPSFIAKEWPHRGRLYRDVKVHLFAVDRVLPWSLRQVVQHDSKPIEPGWQAVCPWDDTHPYARGNLDELLTGDELTSVRNWFLREHGQTIDANPKPVPISITDPEHGSIYMPTTGIAVGGPSDFHMFDHYDGYDAAVRVWGYYYVEEPPERYMIVNPDRGVVGVEEVWPDGTRTVEPNLN